MDLPTPPEGTHELFLVFTHPTDNGGLFNLNHFTALGKGAANSAAPEVTASAEPMTGDAPLAVQFTGTATDPDAEAGRAARPTCGTSAWPARRPTRRPSSSPTLHLRAAGHLPGALHGDRPERGVGDRERPGRGHELRTSARRTTSSPTSSRATRSTPTAGRSSGRTARVRRPSRAGTCNFPIDIGSLYGPGTSARNIIVQPLPERRGRGDGEDHHRAAHGELPAGRPARLPGRQQLGLDPHDLRGHRP